MEERESGEDLNDVGGGPRRWWGRTSTVVEAHAEEERARGVNLDGGRTGGVDLDGGGGTTSRHARRRSSRRGANVEAIGVTSRRTQRRSGRWRMSDKEITGLGIRGLGTLKRKNSSDKRG
jgi:hypothetical protein